MNKFLIKSILFLTLSIPLGANQASCVGSCVASGAEKMVQRVGRNKATYAFFGAHIGAIGALVATPVSNQTKGGIALAGLVAHYFLLGRYFKDSYFLNAQLEEETEAFTQLKILNTTDWLEKNGVIIDGVIYTTGFQLWKAYQEAPRKQHFLRQFLSVIAIDSSARHTQQVITIAVDALKRKLAQCSDPTHERYSNAGLLLGKFFYCHHVHHGKPLPHNTGTWLWQEERGGDLFKTPFGDLYFEQWLNEDFLTTLGVYETDLFARIFSLTEGQKKMAGFTIPWYRISSWSRNGAAHYYVALIKHYTFLLACRALCDQIIAAEVIDQKQDIRW